jgi:hypothetical protein
MPKFKVTLVERTSMYLEKVIEAETEDEAIAVALDEEEDLSLWRQGYSDAEYDVEEVEEVQ